ncbi:MAG: ABC transporter ATP-binding protein [Lachnospiraceae bacterium]|nr:ABC transporter ATP-binding protein [Lachnospiraceae bacterium]
MSLLLIRNLTIAFHSSKLSDGLYSNTVEQEVVHGIDLSLEKGQIVGLVGESGSGKSVSSLSIMKLLPEDTKIAADEMLFDGIQLLNQTEEEWQALRGNRISMVFQEPMTSLNPVLTIEKQVEEGLILHEPETYKDNKALRRERILEVLTEAGLQNPEELLPKYPHQLSGGMRQRVMIAMAMLCRPELLIADEPTTALDAATQEIILELLQYYSETYGTAILFISHDLSLVARLCDRVLVLKNGQVVERGTKEEIFNHPQKAYTKQLVAAARGKQLAGTEKTQNSVVNNSTRPLLQLKNATIQYREKTFFGKENITTAVKNVSFALHQGEILGLVGESGSGKSTISKAVTGLLSLTEGELLRAEGAGRPQMVFQDPYGSLNPAKKIGWILEEPLKIQGGFTKKERKRLVIEALKEVELEEAHAKRYVRELSGGQRQRVAIAAALIQKPQIVILDEPVSALDVTVQGQILELLYRLKQEHGMSYLFVSHDMNVIRRICDRVIVLYRGELVEEGRTADVFERPEHPYTKELLRKERVYDAERKEGKETVS